MQKNLSKDRPALQGVNMDHATATYKLREGLSVYQQCELIKKLKKSNFSINIDECTATNSHKRVFSILVSFYDEILKKVVTEHYESVECILMNSLTLLQKIDYLFKRDGIPWEDLISDLSDNTNYMQGKKSGLDTKLREKAPNMLDIGGDTCHVIHGTVKRFCDPFLGFVEKVLDDLNADTKFSSDIKDYLQEICFLLSLPYLTPPQRTSHRWLSAYDCTNKFLLMVDFLYVLHYSWVPKADRHLYKHELNALYTEHLVTEISHKRLAKIQKVLQVKNSEERKLRSVEKLIEQTEKILLIANHYVSVLLLLKSIVCILQAKNTNIHRIHDLMVDNLKSFFCCFVKYESITNLTSSQLKSFAFKSNVRQMKSFYVGQKNHELIKQMLSLKKKDMVNDFLIQVKQSYLASGKYLQNTYDITNPILQAFSAINPVARGHTLTFTYLSKLFSHFKFTLQDSTNSDYFDEIKKYQLDKSLPVYIQERYPDISLWWTIKFESSKYPILSKIIKAALSIFTGPRVESSFSMMNDIVTPRTSCMSVETYSSYMSVKYSLISEGKSAAARYLRKNVMCDPINKTRAYYLRTARSQYVKQLRETTKIKNHHCILPQRRGCN